MRILANIYKRCIEWLASLSAALLISIMLLVTFHVIGRYFLTRPIPFTVEYSEYVMAIIVFLTAPLVFDQGGHIMVDIFPSRLNAKNRALFEYFISWLLVFLFLLLTYWSALLTYKHWIRGQMVWKTVVIPLWILDIFIVIMGVLLLIGAVKKVQANWRLVRKKDKE
jgi:TRAP-type C4-dicarboxylate transport system permease small subunit